MGDYGGGVRVGLLFGARWYSPSGAWPGDLKINNRNTLGTRYPSLELGVGPLARIWRARIQESVDEGEEFIDDQRAPLGLKVDKYTACPVKMPIIAQ